ncbi:MAG TPA: GNAT family N-acetyltransferase [Flavobacterium sp.]|uniref:GNAT family N-acetyltransferase n=1 Tax=unclassified Flavobacterium TaxID=196869 RepID=UPI000E93084C|nr:MULTISPECIES: GNAT family N-acetyltransferase [unclassified Flavobacterium]HBI00239.1 N-acetyltransferase [Flavobacterium sp.]HRE77802.1 GNAT family N-acetyltransferase [Flavobacterium sp.]
MITLKELSTKNEMLQQLPLIQQLYPEFTEQIYGDLLDEMLPNNYKQLVAFENEIAVGLSGFWVGTKLWCGKYLELDNVIVHPNHRSKGVGKLLTEYLNQKASDLDCKVVALDAYTNNFSAHKFYFNHGFVPKGFHFVKFLEEK